MNNVTMSRASARSGRKWIVRGRVQGVGFRQFTLMRALEIGVGGYVRNLDDGGVEVYACGTTVQLDTLAGYLNRGPRFGHVRAVETMEASLLQSDGFTIR
jgi:acylphosphatase